MSSDRDTTRVVRSWLEEGRTTLPDYVLDGVLDRLPATPQRRAWWPVRRFVDMNSFAKIAVAAAAVIVVAFVGIRLLPGQGNTGASPPSASPAPSTRPSPSASPSQSPSPSPAQIPDGHLPAGTYATQPFAGPGGLCGVLPETVAGQAGCIDAGAEDDSIRISFTIPDGWDGEGNTILRAVEANSPPGGASLHFNRGGWLTPELCGRPVSDLSTGTTVDDFVNALVGHPYLDLTSPVDVTLAGYSGKYLELQAPANIPMDGNAAAGDCTTYYRVWEQPIYAQGPNHLWHLWVLDVDGIRVVVRADTYPGTTAEVEAQLNAIVDSIQIEP